MRAPHPFTSHSGTLAAISRISLGVLLGLLPSCAFEDAVDGVTVDDPLTAEERQALEGDDGINESVCTTGTFRCFASMRGMRSGQRISSYAAPFGLGPAELQSAYRIQSDVIVGAKPTVGIVIAFGYSAIESDLGAYRSQFGLPPCTKANGCLRVVNQRGEASPLPPDPPIEEDWTLETALDVDMVSAACPLCNILVVQADDNLSDGLFLGQRAAVQLGATVISNSWGATETRSTSPAQTTRNESFFNHPNVAIFAASGDHGFNDEGAGTAGPGPNYPATSAHVIAVGGTRLVRAPGARGWDETAWRSGGSACSYAIPKPAYQTASPCPFKANTDIAAIGDPSTGAAVYNARGGGWRVAGGTSASSPFVAAVFAATGNGTQTGAFVASNPDKLNDVIVGNNGSCGTMTLLCNAAAGWDGPTGFGTPNATALLPPGYGHGPNEEPKEDDGILGGCSTSGRGGAGAGLVLAAALLALRRRRARA
jgi:Subtilase family